MFEGSGSLGVPVLAGGQGFEPQSSGSKPDVLPLHHPPSSLIKAITTAIISCLHLETISKKLLCGFGQVLR